MTELDFKKVNSLTDLSKDILLTVAVGYLGGVKKKIYTEEITIKAFEWNPLEFSWSIEKFKKFPDKEAARRPLLNARAYARDLLKDGWRLTRKGLKVYESLSHLIDKRPHSSKLSKKETGLLKKRIKQKKLFKDFHKDNSLEINTYQLAEFLDSTPDNIHSLRRNFYDLYTDIEFINDENIENFFNKLKFSFKEILDEKKFLQDQKVKEKSRA